jgi:ABC-type sugar transport system permease subunit
VSPVHWAARFRSDRAEPSAGQLAFLFDLPATALILAVVGYPVVYAAWVSFHLVGIRELRTGDAPWVGLANYASALADPVFGVSFLHTVIFTATAVTLEVSLGLLFALAISLRGVRLAKLTGLLVLIPWAVPPVVNGIMWSFIFNSQFGYLNAALLQLHLTNSFIAFLTDPVLAFSAVVVAHVWRTAPFSALLFYAALQGIPEELYDAARVDGASAWQRLRGITLPLLKPTFMVVLVLRTLFAFLVFDEILAITYGGPGDSTWVASWYIYVSAFFHLNFGLGSAAAFLLSLAIGLVAVVYSRLLYQRVEYA